MYIFPMLTSTKLWYIGYNNMGGGEWLCVKLVYNVWLEGSTMRRGCESFCAMPRIGAVAINKRVIAPERTRLH